MTTSNFDPLTYAIGAREVASVHAGRLIGADHEVDHRLREAEAALIAARATDVAGLLTKLEIVFDHAHDNRDHFGRLVSELEACQREAAEPEADLAHVAEALTVLARRFEREDASDFDVRLLRSAALDARALACNL